MSRGRSGAILSILLLLGLGASASGAGIAAQEPGVSVGHAAWAAAPAHGDRRPAADDAARARRSGPVVSPGFGVSAGTRRTLRRATLVGLWTTGALGTLVAVNRPTLLDDGRCDGGDPLLGSYGCDELSTVHGMSAVAATVLYTASEVLEVAAGDRDRHPLLVWTHRVGIATLPLAGILSRYPAVIGIRNEGTQEAFGEALRTLHAGAGYVTVLTYSLDL